MIVLGFPEQAAPAAALATELGCASATVDIHRFPDGESRLTLPPALPERVILFRSLNDPNAKLTELLIAAGGARALGARHLTLVAPYLCYMRQDMAFRPGQPVSQRIVGALLAQHFEHLLTIDPHLHRVATLGEAVPAKQATCLTAATLLGDFLRRHVPADACLVGPDEESAQWVTQVAQPGGFAWAVARKQRFGDNHVQVTLPDIDVGGRVAVLVDDVISSGHTMMEAALALRARGATEVSAIATHGLFAAGARDGMRKAGIVRLWVTDTIAGTEEHPTGQSTARISTTSLIAEAIRSSGDCYR